MYVSCTLIRTFDFRLQTLNSQATMRGNRMCWPMDIKYPEINQLQIWLNTGLREYQKVSLFLCPWVLLSSVGFVFGRISTHSFCYTKDSPSQSHGYHKENMVSIIISEKSPYYWVSLALSDHVWVIYLPLQTGIYFNSIRTTWTHINTGRFPRNLGASTL